MTINADVSPPINKSNGGSFVAFAALLLALLSLGLRALDKVSSHHVITHHVSMQTNTDSTRFMLKLEDDLPAGTIWFPNNTALHIKTELDAKSRPSITLWRGDDRKLGSLRCVFPEYGPPMLEQVDAGGAVLWSTSPIGK